MAYFKNNDIGDLEEILGDIQEEYDMIKFGDEEDEENENVEDEEDREDEKLNENSSLNNRLEILEEI